MKIQTRKHPKPMRTGRLKAGHYRRFSARNALEFLHFLPVSGGDEAAEGGLQADRGEQIRLFRHFFAQ